MSKSTDRGITLIGMPGCGKTSVGVILAKELGLPFVDTDIILQSRLGVTLQAYINERSFMDLRDQEQNIILDLPAADKAVIATGGSAVHSERAMHHLAGVSLVFYLQISLATMKCRLGDFSKRGIAADTSQGLDLLYTQRQPLYQRFAEHTVDAEQPVSSVVGDLVGLIRQHG